MQNLIQPTDDEASALPPTPATSHRSLGTRVAELFSLMPDSAAAGGSLRARFLLGLSVILVFVTVSFFTATWDEKIALAPLPLRLFNVAITLVAMAASLVVPFRRWQWWAMSFCLTLAASFTTDALMVDNDEPLFLALAVLVMVSAVFLPWGARWQGWFGMASLGAFTVEVLWGVVEPNDIPRWTALAAAIGLSVSLASLRDYATRQRVLVDESRLREKALQEENSRRTYAEERLRIEIGEREAAQKLAQRREAILRKVLETSLDIIIISRLPNLEYVYVNDQFSALGYVFEDTKGKTAADLQVFANPQQAEQMLAIARERGSVSDFELDVRAKSGKIIPYLVSAVIAEIDGENCLVSMSRDMTQRKQMEQDLVTAREDALAASRAKSEFLSSMSHEIRTPMNAVLGMADLLLDTKLNAEQRRYLDVMVANGNSLLELINSILDLARIESGRMQIEQTEFDLADLIDKTISTFGVQAHSKGIELIARITPGVHTHLIGDPMRLRQILINFLGNAIKFTEKGAVVLEVSRPPDSAEPAELRFIVSDTGIGIPPNKLKDIFSSFTQADSSTTRRYGGTGLGLAIAQRLVKLMAGQIAVESEVGKGSQFSFALRFGLATRVISPTAHVILNLDDYRVLVVDDNQINRLIAREMISNCGAEVSEAECGTDALMAIRQASDQGKPYRIILLDMRMPDMNGLEVAQRIREERLPTEPLVLMLSSDDLKPQLSRLKELHLDAYLVKPITRRELFDAIGRVIRNANSNSADALPERSAQNQPSVEAPMETHRPIILVADDSADNRLLIGAYLRREPYQVEFAENGKLAIEKFKANHYDLVFMDVQMPEIDGLAATRMIRQWEKETHRAPTPIIALTASALEEDVQRTHAAGCDQHLSKPVKKSVLLDAIRKVVAVAGSGREGEAVALNESFPDSV